MGKRLLLIAALAFSVGAAFFVFWHRQEKGNHARPGFVRTQAGHFEVDDHPFRFVGANIAVMYRDEDRAQMPETLAQAAGVGIRVVRVWASGEGGPNDVKPMADFADWPRTHPFRWAPGKWNEEAFVHLDRVLVESARNNLRVQLCLTNWWRDTGGVTQYLRWAGIRDADDDRRPFGINAERAMLFYSNAETRLLYREHLEKIATRRNTVTGIMYRDDPTIFGYELMNEAQVGTGHWAERRAWIVEMSAYLKSLDPDHLIAPGDWGYRSAAERREWLQDHALPGIDYCDVHNYPRDDHDSFVESPQALIEFINNRAAAAFSLRKPLVFGEFGIGAEGYRGFSQTDWFRAFFEGNARAGTGGAMFWILTPDSNRGYGVTYATSRDEVILATIKNASQLFASLAEVKRPRQVTDTGSNLVPHQSAYSRAPDDPGTVPEMISRDDKTVLYRFTPEMSTAARFEKMGGDAGYIWGSGVGSIEYVVPARKFGRFGRVVVRAHIQPVLPSDAKPMDIKTRVTLFINGSDCGSRLIPVEESGQPLIQEWVVDKFFVRLAAARGTKLTIRFAVLADADWLYGVNISNWPEGYDPHGAKPIEVEIR